MKRKRLRGRDGALRVFETWLLDYTASVHTETGKCGRRVIVTTPAAELELRPDEAAFMAGIVAEAPTVFAMDGATLAAFQAFAAGLRQAAADA